MRTAGKKDVLTTGDVARICRVAPRTVSKWFDTGKLRGYRIPGSRDRRIPLQQLVAFMRVHGIPLDGLDQGCCRIMALSDSLPRDVVDAVNAGERYELRTATNGFEAGMIAQAFRPHVVVVDVSDDDDDAAGVCRHVKGAAELDAAKVLAAIEGPAPDRERRLTSQGFDGCIAKPLTAQGIMQAAEEATNLIT
ncbi:MAG TPA: helix-turn-helix domain-containing protein [Phycisphaerae bacterium]|nr:helix-turn-helix domain-containing protein [Phycisphaerae bacterium]